jgi:subtilisin family serine protease
MLIARTAKSLAVQQAGGVGMILVNRSNSSVNADLHFVPTIHLNNDVRAAIITYASTPGATASLGAGAQVAGALAPTMAAFSSRGPLLAGDGNLLKPDITAPGVDVLAAVSPIGYNGRSYDFLSGTSMSSPHIAGVGALMKNLYPNWSPSAIKSALMTTAYQTTRSGTPGLVFGGPFDFGAGHVDPNPAMNPGLVFDAGFVDYLGFLCGTQLPASFCTSSGIPVLNPSNLNVPSIAIGSLAGARTVTRTVTNVSGQTTTFTAGTSGLAGMSVSASPTSFTLAPGASQQVSVTITNNSAPLNTYANGAITWTSNRGHSVRIPVVARPVALGAPATLTSNGSATAFDVTFGYNGPFSATARGLVAPVLNAGTVTQDPDQTFNPADPTGTVAIPVVIPAGTTYTRFALFDADVAPGADLDLYVYLGTSLVGASTNGTSAEEVNFSFANPTGGPIALTVYVHGWGVPGGSSPFTLHSWHIPATNAGNMTVSAPATATLGGTGTVNLSFSGLLPATRYLGSIVYSGAAGMPAPTIVRVNTP